MKNSRTKSRPPRRAGWTPAAERDRLVRAWEAGDQTQREFAQAHRIRYGTFRNWVSARALAGRSAQSGPSIRFQEIP